MSVSPLSRGPRTITEGDVLAIAAELAPTTGRLTTRERDPMTDRDLHPAAIAEALRRADAAMFDRLVAAAFNGDRTADDRRLAEHRDSLAQAIGDLWSSGSPAVRVVADRLDDLASAVASIDLTDSERATCVEAVIAIIRCLAPEVVA
jgi:hypothetical protein